VLPRGALGVSVYAGIDPLSGRRHYLRETVPAGPGAHAAAQKVLRRLAGQVDDRRNPRTAATVDQMLDRYFELLDIEPDTVENYRRLARLHIRPLIGGQKVVRSTRRCSTRSTPSSVGTGLTATGELNRPATSKKHPARNRRAAHTTGGRCPTRVSAKSTSSSAAC
jgi:hypothetical protein